MGKAVCVLGPPGSGKTTQAHLISVTLGLTHLDTGALFRQLIDERKLPEGAVRELRHGDLIDPKIATGIIREELEKTIAANGLGVALSGAPRSVYQAFGDEEEKGIIESLSDGYGIDNLYIFRINLSKEESVLRNTKRYGSRSDDNAKIIRHRLNVYEKETEPIFDELVSRGYKMIEIEGGKSREEIADEIRNQIE